MSATLARKGVGPVDLRFRESDLAQQLGSSCGQGRLEEAEAEAAVQAKA
jgi:hypothetical protein